MTIVRCVALLLIALVAGAPAPRVFGTVSPFDPEMFASVVEYVEGKSGPKYTPLEVAGWLDELADAAMKGDAPRQWAVDIQIQVGIGRFFAAKFRSAVYYERYLRDKDQGKLVSAIQHYRLARAAWAKLAGTAKDVYRPDVSFGYEYQLRGHWLDRLPVIDEDIARMEKLLGGATAAPLDTIPDRTSVVRPLRNCNHSLPARFPPGAPIGVSLTVQGAKSAVILHYRRVNQVERFVTTEMKGSGNEYNGAIPGDYTKSPFAIQYYFELRGPEGPSMYPGLGPMLTNQPYFVVRQA